jgi:hypothetical protein
MQPVVLSTAYFPPVQYLSKLIAGSVTIEAHESYLKQTYRNRCSILAANGPMALTVPVVKWHGERMPIAEVQIDYDKPWQKQHFKSIESAYKSSPFYDYYIDDLMPFFENRYEHLFDFNQRILEVILQSLGVASAISNTTSFHKVIENQIDLRYAISPKESQQQPDPHFAPVEYYQVFSDRHGFTPNLSILDLLFNEGPMAKSILEQSIKKGE